MPFEFGMPIDPNFHKVLQSKIRTLLHSKAEGFPGSYPVDFEQSHMQQLASEEYFVTEKFASVRCMLLSTNTPKGPACFLIDRHNEISFVPHLLLPLRDNPSKYQNETLLDGEMVTEHDGHKTTLRFLVFDLMILNGLDITQRSYSSRLGMLDQDILGVHASKSSEVRAKEPFTIERKTMQRSYGLNIILSGSRKQKQGAEGLVFVPVKQPYISGASPKLLKWKSHTTAQFQIKVTLSKERKPLYCIHVKQGPSSKFYDYVTPDSVQAAEWHTTSPDGKVAEFWWDAQWQTQMFEKGYGLETRTGGWRFNRVREDKKDVDEESTVLALVKNQETLVTKEQCLHRDDYTNGGNHVNHPSCDNRPNCDEYSNYDSLFSCLCNRDHIPDASHKKSAQTFPGAPIKSWMTVAPVPRAPLGEKSAKLGSERRDSRDSSGSGLDTPQRPGPSSRKSSVVSTEGAKDAASAATNASAKSQEAKGSTSINTAPPNTSTSSSQDRPHQTPQTPTPAQTPTIAGTSRSGGAPSLPTPVSFALPNIALPNIALPNIALPNIALPNILHRDTDEKAAQETGTEATSSTTQAGDTAGATPITSPIVKSARNPSVSDVGASKPSPVLGKRTVASSSSAGGRSDDSLAQRRKLSDAMQPSPKSEAVTTGIGSLNLASTLSPQSNNMSSFPPEGTERGSPLLSPLSSPGMATKPNDQQQPWHRSQQSSGSRALKASSLAHEVPPYRSQDPVTREDVAMAEVKDEADVPVSRSNATELKEDVEMEEIAPKLEQGHVTDMARTGPPQQRRPTSDILMEGSFVKSDSRTVSMPVPAPSFYPPSSPAFVMAAQGAYDISGDQEKTRAMAMARAAASSKLDRQLELQISKEKRLLEDIENFKESSRTKKEKSVKQRTREVIEPPVQDRRAQPVRQINQQQGRQSNPDSPALRSQSQLGQRVGSSPQEQQQRLAYTTRQSRSGSRVDPAQTPPANVKPQHRPEQQLVPIEQIDPTGGQVPKDHLHRDQFAGGDRPDSREQMLRVEDVPRQHRRINSMDHRFQQSRPASPSRFDPGAPPKQAISDGRFGQPHSKRLDLGQHGDSKHRRSHSDVGIFHKPIATAIVAPHAIARPSQGPVPTELAPSPQASPHGQAGAEYRQNGQFSQGQQRLSSTGARPEMDDSWMKQNNNSNGSSSVKEAPPVKESKARLQFILNDDPTSPEEEHHDDDPTEHPQSPEAPDWSRRNPPAAESAQRAHALHMAYPDQPLMANDYPMRDHQEAQMAPRAPPSVAVTNPIRRQPSKKQKLSQDMTGQDPTFNGTPDEYEYHMRQSQLHPQARPPTHASQQRPTFPGERWPQPGSTQQHPPQQPMAMQGQPPAGPPPTGGRRVGGEGPAVVLQQPNHHFSGPDMSLHGPSMGRPPHADHQYGVTGHGAMMDGPRPKAERLSHSRHSSLSKAGPEQVQPPGPAQLNARTKAGLPHGSSPVVEQYPRGYPQPPPGAVPGQSRPAPPSQHQPPYQPSPQQQSQANPSTTSRKKAAAEQQPGSYGPPPPGGAPGGYEQRQNASQNVHPLHQQQQQQQQHHQQQHQNLYQVCISNRREAHSSERASKTLPLVTLAKGFTNRRHSMGQVVRLDSDLNHSTLHQPRSGNQRLMDHRIIHLQDRMIRLTVLIQVADL
ncbi:Dcp1p-Dcp2p decapping enzyme complex alpha subunit [Linnemannia gamsii]|uniref:Dcp1p-Dcp2p decapping enzyme complex alpha subunit n=1 Tax=Linnemannia gamsii TaxID=64522 RepID=A0A9P6RHX4_9FUNG|nr:Dcp1p-Dcp2p decapping enzyme complex alpha subunit [Linnemannia gamsii]